MITYLIHGLWALAPYIFILALIILLNLTFVRRYRQKKAANDHIKNHGISTNASIVKRHIGPLTRELIYTYECQGQHYTQIQYIASDAFNSIKEGTDIAVFCLLEHPQEATLADIEIFYLDKRIAHAFSIAIALYIAIFIFYTILEIFLINWLSK